jgi:phosphohistidine phosphatase
MRVYLVQHGEAVPEAENPDRPLSQKGRQDVERLASLLARGGARVARVLHSPKARARDTAVLYSQVLGPNGVVEEVDHGLSPNDTTDAIAGAIAGWEEDVMVVGHLPHMAHLASRLVTGSDDIGVVTFEPGAVACLEAGEATWSVIWMAGPSLIGQ